MTKATKIILYLITSLLGIIIVAVVAYLLETIIIPDACYYHMNQPNVLISMFFDFPSWNGNHPTPSALNYAIIIVSGIFVGVYSLNKYLK